VFHEPRWFAPGPSLPPVSVAGKQVGVLFGDDLGDEKGENSPAGDLKSAGADLLVCLAASPYTHSILEQRLALARRPGLPLLYANLCGGSDDLIYDGRSFGVSAEGDALFQMAGFREDLRVVEAGGGSPAGWTAASPEEELFQALALGVRDFMDKNRLERAFLGLSGGVDSALVAVLAAEALGPGRVTAVSIPSRYTDPRSVESARALCQALGVRFEVVELEPLHRAAESTLGDLLAEGTGAENVQVRLRAVILMAFVNRYGGLLLNTTNKTELSVGYITLYGDMAGMLCPIGDLTKPEVVRLARWYREKRGAIPDFILERPPSAELRPGQVDPFDYAKVSPELERLVQGNQSNEAIHRAEYKRRQMGVILKVSEKAFGSGRMMPITRR
jgi:NAD+ synthetase